MLHSHGIRQTADRQQVLDGMGKTNIQSDGIAGWKNKICMTVCGGNDAVLLTKNKIKSIK